MLGAIAGDMIGSPFEFNNCKSKDFPLFQKKSRFTDDTILTVATADALMNDLDYAETYRDYALRYIEAGFGPRFKRWAKDKEAKPYGSFGNGSGMRVSPVGLIYSDLEEVIVQADRSANVTHDHPEGIKGARVIATAVSAAKNGATKDEIKSLLVGLEHECNVGYDYDRSVDECRDEMIWNATCQETVSESVVAFLEGNDFEDCIRNAVSIGGDSDTIAAMTGSIAHAFYKEIPEEIVKEIIERLDEPLLKVVIDFEKRVGFDTVLSYIGKEGV